MVMRMIAAVVTVAMLGLGAGCALTMADDGSGGMCVDGYIACPPAGFDAGSGATYAPECVDAQTSNGNCGACGVSCGADAVCVDGSCVCGPSGASCVADSNCCAGLKCLPETNGPTPRTCG